MASRSQGLNPWKSAVEQYSTISRCVTVFEHVYVTIFQEKSLPSIRFCKNTLKSVFSVSTFFQVESSAFFEKFSNCFFVVVVVVVFFFFSKCFFLFWKTFNLNAWFYSFFVIRFIKILSQMLLRSPVILLKT